MRIPSDIAALSSTRQHLATWARTTGLTSAAVDDLILASHEAVANAIEHGDRRRGGHITLTAERTDDHVIITVTDHGR